LQRHIDHYWIVKPEDNIFQETPPIYAYPGITPEMLIVLEGHYTYSYLGKTYQADESMMFSYIHGEVVLDVSKLTSFIIIQFKPRVLSSVLPFVNAQAAQIMKQSVCKAEDLFGASIQTLAQELHASNTAQAVATLDAYWSNIRNPSREGFLAEMATELQADCSVQKIMHLTNYSYSTLERHFKKDTGLTPKKYQTIQRFKLAVQEIYQTQNEDWMHYVVKYGYYDQAHFIKDIKRHAKFTPSQLLHANGLINYRP